MIVIKHEATPAMMLSYELRALEEFKALGWHEQRNVFIAAKADPKVSGVLINAYRQVWSPKE